MPERLRPRSIPELADMIRAAQDGSRRLAIRGGGSKDGFGADEPDAAILDMTAFSGIIDYDPAELVLTAGAATPLIEIEAELAKSGQMLAFAPFDHGPIFRRPTGAATLGGVINAGTSGSQRLSNGGARDHLLGFEAVSGRGEHFVAGAKVVKNVTGYDLPKLATGSLGRLFAITQLTVKVLPQPRAKLTRVIEGLGFDQARSAMSRALGSQAEVAAALFRPATTGAPSRTMLQVQGVPASVAARATMLDDLLGEIGPIRPGDDDEWPLPAALDPHRPLWRINVPPSRAPAMMDSLDGDWIADWGGGLIWLASDIDPARIRAAAEAAEGHAMLIRGSAEMRRRVPALHPQQPGVAALEARIRRAFDPAGIFETGRFA